MLKENRVIDQYSYLDYKAKFDVGHLDYYHDLWVGADNLRRLQAYMIYESYTKNDARQWLNTEDETIKDARREYGDPDIIVETALSSLLGEDQSIQVEGVDGTENAKASPEANYQKKLLDWAKKERFEVKLAGCERKAVKLGDGVYVLGWNKRMGRPHLTVWDPGFYFPVWDEEDPSEEYPKTVHIAYDFLRENDRGEEEKYLRRITWQLVPIVEEELDPETGEEIPAEAEEDRPWNGDGPTTHTVLFSDMTWKYEDIGTEDNGAVYRLQLGRAHEIRAEDVDLEIDWIPVIHISNTDTDSGEHWGVSVLAKVMQIIDDLISTDTDLQASSATTGSPPLVVPDMITEDGDDMSIRSYGPGEVIRTQGDSGKAEMIDTSSSLDALIKYDDKLLSRLSVNSRIPESLLGRVKPNEVPSGIALTLSFSPHSSMVREMRQVRQFKYQLLLKMVGRLYLQHADEDPSDNKVTEVFDAKVHFGSFLPADRSETSTLVQTLYTAKIISLETAVRMLVEAGFPIDSIEEEINKIMRADIQRANDMISATGDVNEGRKSLGLAPISTNQSDPSKDGQTDSDGTPQMP